MSAPPLRRPSISRKVGVERCVRAQKHGLASSRGQLARPQGFALMFSVLSRDVYSTALCWSHMLLEGYPFRISAGGTISKIFLPFKNSTHIQVPIYARGFFSSRLHRQRPFYWTLRTWLLVGLSVVAFSFHSDLRCCSSSVCHTNVRQG